MGKQTFTNEFKQGVVNYVLDHPDESKLAVAKQFGIADSTVHKWLKEANNNNGTINWRGSGNYSSDEAKEIARFKKELKDTQDALDVLKKAIMNILKENRADRKSEKKKSQIKSNRFMINQSKYTELQR